MRKGLTYLYLLVGIILIPFKGIPQDPGLEDLKKQLQNSKHDTDRVKTYNSMGELLYTEIPDSAKKLWELGIKLAEKNIASGQAEVQKHKPFYKKQLSELLSNVSFIYYQNGEIGITLKNLQRSLKINEEIGNKSGIALSYNALGYIHDDLGDVTTALDYFHKSLRISEQINDRRNMGVSLNNIAYIYDAQGDVLKALEFYNQDRKIREEIKDDQGLANSLNNIGTIHERRKNYGEALKYHNKSLALSEALKDKNGISLSMYNIGVVYQGQKKFTEALNFYFKSLAIRESITDKDGTARCYRGIANVYLNQGKINEAARYGEKSLEIVKELGFPDGLNQTASLLATVYTRQEKFKKAYDMYALEVQMGDSIYNQKTKKDVIKKQFQYTYEKKAAQDSVKRNEEQKVKKAALAAQEAQLKQEKTQRFVLYGGLIMVLALSGFIFKRFKITQKQKTIIEEQKMKMDLAYAKLHEKNKEVMDSINYAGKIQNSFLPSEKYVSRILDKRFKS